MNRQIQIDESLFREICEFFFGEEAPNGYEADIIRQGLDQKLDKLIARELFSKYKRSPTGAEREKARNEYLDFKGILKDWRSEKEISLIQKNKNND